MRTSGRTAAFRPRALGRAGLGALLLVTAALLATGCQGTAATSEGASASRGKEIFTQKCGSCHAMADAGSSGELGPNLDDAFGYARAHGFDESTFYEIVTDQMRIPAPPMPQFDEGPQALPEDDLKSVAQYVALCAGQGETKPADCTGPAEGPQAVFTASCGGCHTLDAAGTSGTTGPNLDETQVSLEDAVRQITNGGGGMPAFGDDLDEEQIRALAEYVVENGAGG